MTDVDVLVVGGGMAGLSTGAAAARRGARVALVERAGHLGGSAAFSGGLLWWMKSYELLRDEVPSGDPELARVVITRAPDAIEWVRSLGVEVSQRRGSRLIPKSEGHLIDILGYLDRCRHVIESHGGFVVTDAVVEHLVVDDGRVTGGLVRDRDGQTTVRARWTVLATGGFQADPELVGRWIGRGAVTALLRSNPYSRGDGIRLGLDVGAALTPHMNGFYGHLISHPIDKPFEPADFLRLAQSMYSAHTLLLDRAGARFVDESLGYFISAQALAQHVDHRAVAVGDAWTLREYAVRAPVDGMEIVDLPDEAERSGGHVARGETLEELAANVATWGYDADAIQRTVTDYNDAIRAGRPAPMIARRDFARPLTEAPYFAVEVQPAITFTHGGLRIDGHARVLDADARPVPGLMAVGADGAGLHDVGYAGGLLPGAVFALQAADEIAAGADERAAHA
jgi:succinate dehydrogenase/fumarate reductase flavoprotein subunit